MQLISAKHGAEVVERIRLYAVWFAFSFLGHSNGQKLTLRLVQIIVQSNST